MIIKCKIRSIIIIFLIIFCSKTDIIKAQYDTLFVDGKFAIKNLNEVANTYSSNDFHELYEIYNVFLQNKRSKHRFFYFDFNNRFNYISLILKNTDSVKIKTVVEFSNPLISEVIIYKKKLDNFELINKTGINYPFLSRLREYRNFLIPIELNSQESETYIIQLNKEIGRPLVTSARILNKTSFEKQSFMQYIVIGTYYGVSILSILFSLFIFYFLRNYSYLFYALYVIFLGLFLSSYLGIFYQYFLDAKSIFNKYTHYVLFSEVSLIMFIIFSQKILKAKEYVPRLKKFVDISIIFIIAFRFALHFIFSELFSEFIPSFMKIWYGFILATIIAIIFEIIAFYRNDNKKTSFFVIAFLFMTSGVLITVLYHSYGLINTYLYGLPIIFYSSFFEILFLTFTIVYMVKDIYDERNILSNKLAYQQQQFLTAFVDGQEKERERIGEELHDNVGSKLSNFKRLLSREYSNKKMDNQIDIICNDVRELSHQLMPSEIKLVGLPGAISDLITKYSEDGLTIEFNCYEFPNNINETITTSLYRVVQESLNNIVKHAEANTVDVQIIGHKDHLTLSIEDDGKGFNKSKLISGIGLRNIKSRIKQLKGDFLLDTSLNKGTSILITVPIR